MNKQLPYILVALIGFSIGRLLPAAVALAANKTASLAAPTSYTSGGWTIVLTSNAGPGGTATSWSARTSACGYDQALEVSGDCTSNLEVTATPPAEITTFVNNRLAAWRAAKGY